MMYYTFKTRLTSEHCHRSEYHGYASRTFQSLILDWCVSVFQDNSKSVEIGRRSLANMLTFSCIPLRRKVSLFRQSRKLWSILTDNSRNGATVYLNIFASAIPTT